MANTNDEFNSEEDMIVCENCGDAIECDDAYIPLDHHDFHCIDCVSSCSYCGDLFVWLDDHRCRECGNCGDSICPEEYYSICDDCGEYGCDNCGECTRCDSSDGIRRYHDNPALVFHGTGNVFMGVELEFDDAPHEILSAVKSFDDCEEFVWLCDDGSIGGAEIISHPMTLDAMRRFPFDSLLSALDRTSATVHDGTGIHVHIGRDSFKRNGRHSQAHVARWLKFLYSNKAGCELIARRDSRQWAEFCEFDSDGYKGYSESLTRKSRRSRTCDNRYQAVNTTNSATYEVRIFKSTFDYAEFMACVEFVHATVEYTRNRTLRMVDAMQFEAFADWAVYSGRYPSLSAVLVARSS